MKNKILKIFFTVALFITSFLGLTSVNAFNTSLSPSKTTVNPGDTFTITVNVSGLTNKLGSANYNVTFDNTLFEYISCTHSNSNLVNNVVKLAYFDATGGENSFNNGTFATITFKAKTSLTSDATGNFTLTSSGTLDKDAASITSTNSGTSVKVHIVSDDSTLSDLKVDGTTISNFNKNTTSYKVTTEKSSVSITASASSTKSTITGTGTKTLSYGDNTYEIVVTSEKGTKKTYKVVITRKDTRSDDATLKSLSIPGVNFAFKSEQTTYDLTIDKETISVSATANNSNAKVTGDTGTKKLNYGTNKLTIKVTSEKGSTKTYTLNIKRNDTRSANNNLASLSLSSGKITFKASTTTYNLTVDSSVSKITINATLADSKASFVSGYEPRTVNLSNGNNKILIKVKNEKGEVKTYTLNINKDDGRDTNADLEYLKVSEGTIDFNKDTLEYKITVDNSVTKLTLDTKAVSSKAKVSVTNPTLSVGENKVKIIVTAENGATKEYVITVIRKEKNVTLSDDNYLSSLEVQGYDLNFDRNTFVYNLTIKDEENLIINSYPSNENSSVNILGNSNLKDGSIISIRVTSESGETREYQINISKGSGSTTNASSSSFPTQYIVVGLLVIVLIVLIIIIFIKKNKEKENIGLNNNVNNQNTNTRSINLGNNLNINNTSNVSNNSLNNQSNTNNLNTQNTQNNIENQNVSTNTNTISPNSVNIQTPTNSGDANNVNSIISNLSTNNSNNNQTQNTEQNTQQNTLTNNPSGLTKVCSSCGRRVPYEAGTCPYCMTDF